jgi:hypothetical protein
MKTTRIILALLILTLTSCRAHMVTIRLVNSSAEPISTIIVDYPSATFGKDKLAPREAFSSPVKITGTGPLKVQFTNAKGSINHYLLPVLHPNEEGSIEIDLNQTAAVAVLHLKPR